MNNYNFLYATAQSRYDTKKNINLAASCLRVFAFKI